MLTVAEDTLTAIADKRGHSKIYLDKPMRSHTLMQWASLLSATRLLRITVELR